MEVPRRDLLVNIETDVVAETMRKESRARTIFENFVGGTVVQTSVSRVSSVPRPWAKLVRALGRL